MALKAGRGEFFLQNQPELDGAGTDLLTAMRQEIVDKRGQIALGDCG